jgi:hypothetical protein
MKPDQMQSGAGSRDHEARLDVVGAVNQENGARQNVVRSSKLRPRSMTRCNQSREAES